MVLRYRPCLSRLEDVLSHKHGTTLRFVDCIAAAIVVWAVDQLTLLAKVG